MLWIHPNNKDVWPNVELMVDLQPWESRYCIRNLSQSHLPVWALAMSFICWVDSVITRLSSLSWFIVESVGSFIVFDWFDECWVFVLLEYVDESIDELYGDGEEEIEVVDDSVTTEEIDINWAWLSWLSDFWFCELNLCLLQSTSKVWFWSDNNSTEADNWSFAFEFDAE